MQPSGRRRRRPCAAGAACCLGAALSATSVCGWGGFLFSPRPLPALVGVGTERKERNKVEKDPLFQAPHSTAGVHVCGLGGSRICMLWCVCAAREMGLIRQPRQGAGFDAVYRGSEPAAAAGGEVVPRRVTHLPAVCWFASDPMAADSCFGPSAGI